MRCTALFVVALALALPVHAQTAPDAAAIERDGTWTSRLLDAERRIDLARQRVADAKAAVSEARHRRHPRGAALAEIEREREKAEEELAEAEAALPELLERARSEGVSPTVLMRFEPEAAAGD
jgi:septal ring factor EnvC (AmiA/AmiB activator)